MTISSALLQPVVVLVLWSLVIWVWMYATRIPAIQKARMQLDSNAVNGVQMSQLPADVRWKADNYNHLMEQPTIFYAIVLSLAMLGADSELNLILAWSYVVLRIVHSLVQTLGNKIIVRFGIFVLSSLALIGLTLSAASAVF